MIQNQIPTILEGALKQVYGDEAISATDLTGLIAEGSKLVAESANEMVDNLYKALLDRVRLLVIPGRQYVEDVMGLLRDYAVYGAIVEKIYYEPIEAQENASWKPVKNGDTDDPFKITLNEIDVRLFSTRSTFEVPYSWQEVQIKTAFTSEQEMSRFIEGIFQNARNSFSVKIETVSKWVMANFIGQKYLAQGSVNGLHVLHLVTEYNAFTGNNITFDEAIISTDFQRWAVMRIANIRDLMRKMNRLFNTAGFKRFTPEANQRMCFLSAFANAVETQLYSQTWHNEFVKLPTYSTTPYWQGVGEDGSWANISAIDIKTASGDVVKANNVIGIIYDDEAMGITTWNMRTTMIHNPHNEWNNAWIKGDLGLFNDLSENAVVFDLN